MPIKDVFGPVAAGGGGGAAWAYDPAKTYIAGMGVTTQASVPGSYQVRFYSPADNEWSGEGDTAYGVVGTNNYGWQTVTNGKYVIVNTAGTPYGLHLVFLRCRLFSIIIHVVMVQQVCMYKNRT